jgi:protein TonB
VSESSTRQEAPKLRRRRSRDIYGWVLVASLLAHTVLVFGISFVMPSQAGNRDFSPPMKIMLVSTPTDEEPEQAEALAQANSLGEPDGQEPPLIALDATTTSAGDARKRERLLLEEQADAWLNPSTEQPAERGDRVSAKQREALMESIDVAFLNAQSNPRERFVHANTRSSALAPYIESWRLLVERVGNLNYPDEAKRRQLEGELVLDVAVHADGSVDSVRILRSSGHKVLDDGAERIVQIAAPFDPFSEEMRRDYDILHIIRTWKFSRNTITDITR